MGITALSRMSPREVHDAVSGFSAAYTIDWQEWVASPDPATFGQVLRRWQATRPEPMRRTQRDGQHPPPFLDDLLDRSKAILADLGELRVTTLSSRSSGQDRALRDLWELFSMLAVTKPATCVGISKAVLLVTYGRIGPALDSRVRAAIGTARPGTSGEWIRVLEFVRDDIAMFERRNAPLSTVVPDQFNNIEYGRLYDMALGPR
jgi:hypothetical protein